MATAIADYAASWRVACKEALEFMIDRKMRLCYIGAIALVAVWSGIYRGNILTLAGFGLGISILLGHFWLWDEVLFTQRCFIKLWLVDGSLRSKAWEQAKRENHIRIHNYREPEKFSALGGFLYLLFLFGVIPLFFSSMTTTWCFGKAESARYAVTAGKVVPLDGRFVISSPFASVKWIPTDKINRVATLSATTRDNVTVKMDARSNVLLPPNRESVLKFAEHEELYLCQFDIRLQGAFQKVVGEIDLTTLPSEIGLTCMVYYESLKSLEGLPLVWDGPFMLTTFRIIRR